MRTPLLALLVLLVTPGAFAALGTPGPFVGVVQQGQSVSHAFSNDPPAADCLHVMTYYTVILRYQPASDRLTVSVPGKGSVTGAAGSAYLSFPASMCTSFTVTVTGTSVASLATYEVLVVSNRDA